MPCVVMNVRILRWCGPNNMETDKQISVLLLGNPNVGKSALFNTITGAAQTIGNWCGKTTEACTMSVEYGGRQIAFTDLPGVYGLGQHSREEVVVKEAIAQAKPDMVLVIVDALNIERNLFIVLQALERFGRVAVVINKLDLAVKNGVRVDVRKLQQELQVPVLTAAVNDKFDTEKFYATLFGMADGAEIRKLTLPYSTAVEMAIAAELERLYAAGISPQRGEAIRNLEEHEKWQVQIVSERYNMASELAAKCCRQNDSIASISDKIDYWALHKYYGLPIMIAVFGTLFYFTFAISGPLSEYIGQVFDWLGQWVHVNFNVWGFAPALTSLVADGLLRGIGAAVGFLPQMAVFFLVYTLLQDSGYLVRVAFLMDRIMRALGLNGKTFLPLVIGCTCNVNGIVASRILTSNYDRIVAIMISSYVPCSARLGVMIFLVSAFFNSMQATLVMLALFAGSVILMAVVASAVKWFVDSDEQTGLLMEVPPYQLPDKRNLLLVTYRKTCFFLGRIRNVIIWTSVVIWYLSSYPVGPFEDSYIAAIGKVLEPFGQLLGLNWQLIVALILGIAAKETALSSLGIMFHAAEDTGNLSQVLAANIEPLAAFTFIFVYMIYTPCITTIMTIYQETKNWRFAAVCVATNFILALVLGMIIYNVGRLL